MSSVYILAEIGWEYNDEYYYRSYNGGSHPLTVYRSEKAATEACQEKNVAHFKSLVHDGDTLMGYLGEDNCDDFVEYVKEVGGVVEDDWGPFVKSLPDNLSDAQYVQMMKLSGLSFYEVLEVEEAAV